VIVQPLDLADTDNPVYSIKFDGCSKEVLLGLVKDAMGSLECQIMGGDSSTDIRVKHKELVLLYEGILYSEPTVLR